MSKQLRRDSLAKSTVSRESRDAIQLIRQLLPKPLESIGRIQEICDKSTIK